MLKKILTTAAPLALLALAAAPAQAADYGAARVASAAYQTWADLSVAAGIDRFTNWDNDDDTKSVVRGEARFGTALGAGAMLQVDLSGQTRRSNNDGDTTFDLAAHLGMMAGTGGYGVMVSTGSNDGFSVATIAGEGVWALGFAPARLTAQLGWTVDTTNSNFSEGYIHGAIDFTVGPNMLLSVNLGYASDSYSTSTWRYGASVTMGFNSMLAGFLAYEGAHYTNGSQFGDDNKVLLGVKMAVGAGSVASSSPLHDWNNVTGVNHSPF